MSIGTFIAGQLAEFLIKKGYKVSGYNVAKTASIFDIAESLQKKDYGRWFSFGCGNSRPE